MFESLKHPEEIANKANSLIFIYEDKHLLIYYKHLVMSIYEVKHLLIYYKHLVMSKIKVFEENACMECFCS